MKSLNSLFQPIKIGEVELKNRLVMLSMDSCYVVDDRPTQRWHDFYAERVRGGVGLIIFPVSPIQMPATDHIPGMYDDRSMDGLRKLVQLAHEHDARVGAQLVIARTRSTADGKMEYVGPSDIPATAKGPATRALSIEEIAILVEAYGEGVKRCREAGLDLVEFHFGMGQLVNRFISSATNHRDDDYGGSMEKRLRLPLEIIAHARQKAGLDYTLTCRISADEFMPGGHTLKETQQVAPLLVQGGLAALNIQAGWHESTVPMIQPSVPKGAFVYLAEGIKKVVDVPVVAAYRINDPVLADRIVAEGRADLVGMGRALLADPELPNKAREGRFEEIRPCLACSRCFENTVLKGMPLTCAVNARTGHEGEYQITPAEQKKRVFVVGGGPGGMEVACVAALRGHDVTLFDKAKKLGGQLQVAAIPPHKEEIAGLVTYLTTQVKQAGVKLNLGQEATVEGIVFAKPDVVIVATGAVSLMPPILGIRGSNVVTAVDVLLGKKFVGRNVLIIGGGLVGCETALHLAKQGVQVTILEMLDRIGADIGATNRWVILRQLKEAGVETRVNSRVTAITDEGVEVNCAEASESLKGDTVIVAAGMKSDRTLADELEGKVSSLHVIGDCAQPGRIGDAIEDGFRLASRL